MVWKNQQVMCVDRLELIKIDQWSAAVYGVYTSLQPRTESFSTATLQWDRRGLQIAVTIIIQAPLIGRTETEAFVYKGLGSAC